MFKALAAKKLGHALGPVTEDPETTARQLRVALLGAEDALTSTVFGRISYLSAQLQREVLDGAEYRCLQGPGWAPLGSGELRWSFWRTLSKPAEVQGTWLEPDVLLRCGEQVVIFEVKLGQNHSAGQWRDQMSVVLRRFGCPPKYLRYVAVGGHDSHNDEARVSALGQGLSEVGVFRLQWAELAASLLATRQRPRPQVLERGVRSMLGDAVRALELVGHPPRRDLITLKRLALANESLDVMRDWTPTHEQLR